MKKTRWPDVERRKFPRLKENIFILCHSSDNIPNRFKAIVQNISGGGLMFESEIDILPERELEVEIYQPIAQSKEMIFSTPARIKVIWTKRIEKKSFEEGENRYRIGAAFSEIEEEDRQRIIKYVKIINALEK